MTMSITIKKPTSVAQDFAPAKPMHTEGPSAQMLSPLASGVVMSIDIHGRDNKISCKVFSHKKYPDRVKLVVGPKAREFVAPFVADEHEAYYSSLNELQQIFPETEIEVFLDTLPLIAAVLFKEILPTRSPLKPRVIHRVYQVCEPQIETLKARIELEPLHVCCDASQTAAMLDMQAYCDQKGIVFYHGAQSFAA
jgi:hypothetical protein